MLVGMVVENADRTPTVARVECEDPLVLSCAVCGWTPGCTGTFRPLYWAVIRHWLTAHWEWGPQLPDRGPQ